jgi:vancomycin permeability regulator SanA
VRRRLAIAILALPVVVAGANGAIHLRIAQAARGRVFSVEEAPNRGVAIVFGASLGSRLLRDRVATGARLYREHKVHHLLLSGDNRRRSYDEPRAMRKMALEAGVPEGALVLDYAGRRTYDSCARARNIFGLDDAILVTQRFHLARALYLCQRLGFENAVGVEADRQAYPGGVRQGMRELAAQVKAWLDVNVHRPTVMGGPALPIRDTEEAAD